MTQPKHRAGARERSNSEAAGRIIAAVETLLAQQHLETITISQILETANVARGTFYLWFPSKYAVVAEAHRRVMITLVHDAAPFLDDPDAGEQELRSAIEAFIETWRQHGPILAASSELWRGEPALLEQWQASMSTIIDAFAARLAARQKAGSGVKADPVATAHALVWMNERTTYMAAAGLAPVALGPQLVDTLVAIWMAVLGD